MEKIGRRIRLFVCLCILVPLTFAGLFSGDDLSGNAAGDSTEKYTDESFGDDVAFMESMGPLFENLEDVSRDKEIASRLVDVLKKWDQLLKGIEILARLSDHPDPNVRRRAMKTYILIDREMDIQAKSAGADTPDQLIKMVAQAYRRMDAVLLTQGYFLGDKSKQSYAFLNAVVLKVAHEKGEFYRLLTDRFGKDVAGKIENPLLDPSCAPNAGQALNNYGDCLEKAEVKVKGNTGSVMGMGPNGTPFLMLITRVGGKWLLVSKAADPTIREALMANRYLVLAVRLACQILRENPKEFEEFNVRLTQRWDEIRELMYEDSESGGTR
jgi:hypothetical protein